MTNTQWLNYIGEQNMVRNKHAVEKSQSSER